MPSPSHPPTTILFDLGLRRPLTSYPPAIVHRLQTVIHAELADAPPASSAPALLQDPEHVAAVVISHVHYDHVGDPRPWVQAGVEFIVGEGGRALLESAGGEGPHMGHYEPGLLEGAKVRWVRPPRGDGRREVNGVEKGGRGSAAEAEAEADAEAEAEAGISTEKWFKLDLGNKDEQDMTLWLLPLLPDGSIHIVDAPGHLPGHLNLLVRIHQPPTTTSSSSSLPPQQQQEEEKEENEEEWVYLAADTCHDTRLLHGTHSIATYRDASTHQQQQKWRCAHHDKAAAEAHIRRVRRLEEVGVTVLLSHEESRDGRFR